MNSTQRRNTASIFRLARIFAFISGVLVAAFAPSNSLADIYSYQDERGVTHYSNIKKEGYVLRHAIPKSTPDSEAAERDLAKQRARPEAKIGMTTDQVLHSSSWGKPERMHRTSTKSGHTEQWVYPGGFYLYFTAGRVSAIQTAGRPKD